MAVTETEIQENGTVTETQEERTFTQAELDEIVQSRLSKEKAKFADYDEIKSKAKQFDEIQEASKTELQKATEKADALQAQIDAMTKEKEIREVRENVSKETGVPVDLLTADTTEECEVQAKAILAFAKPGDYPSVKDGGEARTSHNQDKVKQFENWFNEQFE